MIFFIINAFIRLDYSLGASSRGGVGEGSFSPPPPPLPENLLAGYLVKTLSFGLISALETIPFIRDTLWEHQGKIVKMLFPPFPYLCKLTQFDLFDALAENLIAEIFREQNHISRIYELKLMLSGLLFVLLTKYLPLRKPKGLVCNVAKGWDDLSLSC